MFAGYRVQGNKRKLASLCPASFAHLFENELPLQCQADVHGGNLLRSLISRPGLLWVQMSCTPVCHSLPLPPGRVTGDFLDSQTAVQACPELCHLPAIHRAYVAGSCAQSQPEELSDPVPFRGVRKQPRVQPELEQSHRRTRSLRGSIGWTRFSWPPEETDAGRASSDMREGAREGTWRLGITRPQHRPQH